MKNPRIITPIGPITGKPVAFNVPTYLVTDDGIIDGPGAVVAFCKGDKTNPDIFRQEGFFSETLLEAVKQHLESVNVGELATRETAMAITKLDEGLMWIKKRSDDRELRGVQGTYTK